MNDDVIDIFNIPLYYISFKKNSELENNLKNTGFKDINHFEAIDGRKFKVNELLNDNIITIRTYNDIIYGRQQHTGMPTLGGIGCTLSHLSLWEYCVNNNLPYIIITEDDIILNKKISSYDIKKISNSLKQKNGGFISSSNFKKNSEYFFGTHFYIITNGCARELIKYALPIDIQTDAYINNINNRDKINLLSYNLIGQKIDFKTSIQDTCFKCFLPKSIWFYIFFILILILIIILYFITRNRLKKTRNELDSCMSSR